MSEYERTPGTAPPAGYPAKPPPAQYPPPYATAPQPQPYVGVPAQGNPAPQVITAPTRVPFYPGSPPPVAPPGYTYIMREEFSIAAIILAIIFFPLGLLFLLCLREQYWLLVPVQGAVGY